MNTSNIFKIYLGTFISIISGLVFTCFVLGIEQETMICIGGLFTVVAFIIGTLFLNEAKFDQPRRRA